MKQRPSDNEPRYRPGRGIHESWFLRANHPSSPKALWLKFTLVAEPKGEAVASVWCSLFDGEAQRTWAGRQDLPISEAQLEGEDLRLGAAQLCVDPRRGRAQGALRAQGEEVSWDLRWSRVEGPLGEPLSLLPSRALLDGPLPKSKLITPAPVLRCSGTLTWSGVTWRVEDWLGMQGHNWSFAPPTRYAWGQCIFADEQGAPFAVAEALSGRIKIAGLTTPDLSLLTLRRGGREYRFDRMVDLWNQRADVRFPDWTLRMKGLQGEALLSMRARPDWMVCLGYKYPSSSKLSYCLNSKLASVSLRVNPVNEDPFELNSLHGGALEFLQPMQEARIQPVV
ncbi:hypothetical protein KKF91_19285 [Myxococcota bacterium]|nr:hypothetical protein [Myxococcota bacterium]MBU1432690.1 hypothetical protein [Myxococcota bacterium]MBU1898009.1 hypothetical protein [Myxococcota bacterium]